MTKLEAEQVVGMLVAAYPSWKPTTETISLYVSILTPLPATAAREAVMGVIVSDREFAPPIGIIVKAVAEKNLALGGRPTHTPEEAWGIVMGEIKGRGYYQGPGTLAHDPAIKKAVDALDWKEMCSNENIEATRAHFMRLYAAFARRNIIQAAEELGQGAMLETYANGLLEYDK